MTPSLVLGQATPLWWAEYHVTVGEEPESVEGNYVPVNLGQLKWTATQAKAYLDTVLAAQGGSQIDLTTYFPGMPELGSAEYLAAVEGNYQAANLGQLKAVAKPFYDRLNAAGFDTRAYLVGQGYPADWASPYPWPLPTGSAEEILENYAPANVGQLKLVFGFTHAVSEDPGDDEENPGGTPVVPTPVYPGADGDTSQGSAPVAGDGPDIPIITITDGFQNVRLGYNANYPLPHTMGSVAAALAPSQSFWPGSSGGNFLVNGTGFPGVSQTVGGLSDRNNNVATLPPSKAYNFSVSGMKGVGLNFSFDPTTFSQTWGLVSSHAQSIAGKCDQLEAIYHYNSTSDYQGRFIGPDTQAVDRELTDGEKKGIVEFAVFSKSRIPKTGEIANVPTLSGSVTISGVGFQKTINASEFQLAYYEEEPAELAEGAEGAEVWHLHTLVLDGWRLGGSMGLTSGESYTVSANLRIETDEEFSDDYDPTDPTSRDQNWESTLKLIVATGSLWTTSEWEVQKGELLMTSSEASLTAEPRSGDRSVFELQATGLIVEGTPKLFQQDLVGPADEASGARYRKVAVNGQPLSDQKPQADAESDQQPEETYIDAMTLQLHHQTSDAYLPVPASDMVIQVRRDAQSEVWNHRYGQRPWERREQPFGVGWNSNLCSHIRFTDAVGTASQPAEVPTATVVDEQGASFRFLWKKDGDVETFFPFPSSKHEQASYLCALKKTATGYEFTRKFGTKLTFAKIAVTDEIPADRMVEPMTRKDTYTYARLVKVVDRLGNQVNYTYANAETLIPQEIVVNGRPNLKVRIATSNGLVTDIWDANGYQTSYHYTSISDGVRALTSVVYPDGNETRYEYGLATDPDQRPRSQIGDPAFDHYHCDLQRIVDAQGNAHVFTYAFDRSRFDFYSTKDYFYQKTGIPRNVVSTTLPGGVTGATFVNNSQVKIFSSGSQENVWLTGESVRETVVTNALGFSRTYMWEDPEVVVVKVPPKVRLRFPIPPNPILVCYKTMIIDMGGYGEEVFTFDVNAGMAVSSATDLSGNSTFFTYEDPIPTAAEYNDNFEPVYGENEVNQVSLNAYFNDPTSQRNECCYESKVFTYNDKRIMERVVDELWRTTEYTIDSLGRRTQERVYDDAYELVQQTDFAYGNVNFPGFLTEKRVRALQSGETDLVVAYEADANGRVAREIVAPGSLNLTTAYAYTDAGDKLTVTDPLGRVTAFSYDKRHRLVGAGYPDGSSKTFTYDARGNKVAETDELGFLTTYTYDAQNRQTGATRHMAGSGADITTSQGYNAINAVISQTDARGHTSTLAYDDLGRLISTTSPSVTVDDGSGVPQTRPLTTTFAYDPEKNAGGSVFSSTPVQPTQTVDARGVVATVEYDAMYRPYAQQVRYGAGVNETASSMTWYDEVGNLIQTRDPLYSYTHTSYDALNRPTWVTTPDYTTQSITYTSTGLKQSTTDELGRVTTYTYDAAGRLIQTTLPAVNGVSPVVSAEYDANGNVTAQIDPLGRRTEFIYDVRNRKVRDILPQVYDAASGAMAQPILKTVYDLGGRVIAQKDAYGNTTRMTYDAAGRLIQSTLPAGDILDYRLGDTPQTRQLITQNQYDANGNIVAAIDGRGGVTRNVYDALNRLVQTTDAEGLVVQMRYDAAGNRTVVVDGEGNSTRFTYDGLNRNLQVIDAAGEAVTFVYDAVNKTRRIDSEGRITDYAYTPRHWLRDVSYQGRSADNLHYTHDAVGNILSVETPNDASGLRNVGYTYDALNRVIAERTGSGSSLVEHLYTYDLAGNRIGTVYGRTGRGLVSTYDNLNRLLTLTEDGRSTSYGYDLNGATVRKTLPNGDVTQSTLDALGRVREQSTLHGTVLLQRYTMDYDGMGNVTRIAEEYADSGKNRTVQNHYDSANRLVEENVTGAEAQRTRYTYDAAHNRLSKTVDEEELSYVYNELNQLVSYTLAENAGTAMLAYDKNGNRVSLIEDAHRSVSYTYDHENRLLDVVGAGTSGNYASYEGHYTYDYRMRRLGREDNAGSPTRLVFSGGTSVAEFTGASLGLAATALSPEVEYIRGSDYGGGVGGILYALRGGLPSYTHYNHRGDVTAKTDESGTLTYQASYEAFGTRTQETGATLDRQKGNTKEEDPSGLLNEGFRYRDLTTGVFITRDPAGFIDGPNLYAYVVQNPWSKFDPLGLNEVIISGGINTNKHGWDVKNVSDEAEVVLRAARKLGAEVAHDRRWNNFILAAKTEIRKRKDKLPAGEKIEWHVEVSSYMKRARSDELLDTEYLSEIIKIASDEGVSLRFFKNKKEFEKNINTSFFGKSARENKEKISRMTFFGHGAPGELWLQYNKSASSFKGDDIKKLNHSAFADGCSFYSYACNSATPNADGSSFRDEWKKVFSNGGEFFGVKGKTNYEEPSEVKPSEGAKWIPEEPKEEGTKN